MNGGAVMHRPGVRAGLVFVGMFAFLFACRQPETYGDGITMLYYLQQGKATSHHLLFLPALLAVGRPLLALGVDLRTAALVFSALCAAGGTAVLYYLLATSKRLVPEHADAWTWTLLAATTPVLVYYGTQIENHAHHYFWVCVFLLVFDRAAASNRLRFRLAPLPILICCGFALGIAAALPGLALACVYSSHTSSILLMPALLVWAWWLSGRPATRPGWNLIAQLVALFLPAMVVRLLEPKILGSDFSRNFALSLLELRSPATWAAYLLHELLVPLAGVLAAVIVLIASRRIARRQATLLGLVFAPYVLFFGHWNVYERGAYYLPLVPVACVLLASTGRLTRQLRVLFCVFVVAQAGYATWNVLTLADRTPQSEEKWARDAAAAVGGPNGTVICWSAFRGLPLRLFHGLGYQSFEANQPFLHHLLQTHPDAVKVYAKTKLVPALRQGLNAGPVLVSQGAVDFMRATYPILLSTIDAAFVREPVNHGVFHGYRLVAR